ncbi:sensor histidine kinase [Sphingomonas sp. RS2018]
MSQASTTLRLALLVFACQIVAAAAILAGSGAYVRWEIARQTDAAVDVLRDDLLAVYARDGLPGLARTIGDRATRRVTPGAVVLLADARHRPVAGNLSAWPADATPGRHGATMTLRRTGHDGPETVRVRVTRLPEGSALLSGLAVRGETRAIAVLADASVAALVLAALLAAVAAWLAARMFASRLAEPVRALEAAQRGDLSLRVLPGGGHDAFAALATVVNATLDRLHALIDELRLATDAMAHDLKSPVTRLRAALDRAGDAATDPAAARAIAQAQEEAGRLLAIIETSLSIRRADAGVGHDGFVAVDLAAMLSDLAEIYGPVAEDAGRAVVVLSGPAAMRPVQRELLGQAIGNLIDNGLKYGAGTITLSVTETSTGLSLSVADEGRGIPAALREAALRRFGRLDSARSASGAGLGLSLVAAVARLHGGHLILDDAVPGLIATIRLPAAAEKVACAPTSP